MRPDASGIPECLPKLFACPLKVHIAGWPAASPQPQIAPIWETQSCHIPLLMQTASKMSRVKIRHSSVPPVVFFALCESVCVSPSWTEQTAPLGQWPSRWPRQRHVSVPRVVIQGHLTLQYTPLPTFARACHSALMIECSGVANSSMLPWPWHFYSTWHVQVVWPKWVHP